jgi:hypothetical protein
LAKSSSDQGPPEDFQERFTRIEDAVDAGETGLSKLGFWTLVREIKREPMLSEHWAETIGRIDRKAYDRRVRPRFPVWFGNAVLLAGTAVGGAAIGYATVCDNRAVAGGLLVGSGAVLSVTVHDLAHWAIGRLRGIRFLSYFLDGPFRIQPGLKTDYATYLRAAPESRATMHAAGAVASKVAPFVALGLWPISDAPAWAAWALAALGGIQILTDVAWSTKKSDWKRFGRERAVARAQRVAR